jgi:beta-lactamase regulating signal transducer with metallopeptidase domain
MSWLSLQSVAQISIEHVLNSLPEGLLIALLAWLVLRLIGRQNSGTRFAVWFIALLAIALLPFIGAFTGSAALVGGIASSKITVPVSWAVILFAAWALAACAAVVRLLAGLYRLATMRAGCTPIDISQLDPSLAETVRSFNESRPVTIATSVQLRVPTALGFWKPMIVIPAWALRDLSSEELRIILLHEFAHLRRRDDWTNLLQKIVRAIFFFHPAVWWIDARLSLEREMACDDAVLAETSNPRAYASCLVSLLEKSSLKRGWAMAQAAVDRAREASLRIAQILDRSRPATTRLSKPALGLAGLLSLAGVVLLVCSPRLIVFAPDTLSRAGDSDSIALNQIPAAAVVPAAYHPVAYPLDRSPKRTGSLNPALARPAVLTLTTQHPVVRTATVGTPVSKHRHLSPHSTVIHSSIMQSGRTQSSPVYLLSAPERPQPRVVMAALNQTQAPSPSAPMLVVVQTTQYVESGSSAWTIQAWQVFLVNQRDLQNGAIANTI